jgi:hypothetical protein
MTAFYELFCSVLIQLFKREVGVASKKIELITDRRRI